MAPDRTRRGQSGGKRTRIRSSIADMRASEKGAESDRAGVRISRCGAERSGWEGSTRKSMAHCTGR